MHRPTPLGEPLPDLPLDPPDEDGGPRREKCPDRAYEDARDEGRLPWQIKRAWVRAENEWDD